MLQKETRCLVRNLALPVCRYGVVIVVVYALTRGNTRLPGNMDSLRVSQRRWLCCRRSSRSY